MNILTGNDLKTGDVLWWAGSGWSRDVDDATDVGSNADDLIAAEQAAQRVFAAYVVDATQTGEGVRPGHIKERIRALGPTVRLDLTLKPADPEAGNRVI